MSEDGAQAVNAAEQAHRYSGAVGVGDELDAVATDTPAARTVADLTPEERAYNRQVFGVTHRERYGQPAAGCVSYCQSPGQRRRGARCPACYGSVEIRPLDGSDVEPGPSRGERFAAWAGGWVGSFLEAMMFPFRVGRAHTEALVRELLQESTVEIDGLADILATLEDIRSELHAMRNAADAAGERALWGPGLRPA